MTKNFKSSYSTVINFETWKILTSTWKQYTFLCCGWMKILPIHNRSHCYTFTVWIINVNFCSYPSFNEVVKGYVPFHKVIKFLTMPSDLVTGVGFFWHPQSAQFSLGCFWGMNFLTHVARCSGSTAFVSIRFIKAGLLLTQGTRFEPHLITETQHWALIASQRASVYKFLYFQWFLLL